MRTTRVISDRSQASLRALARRIMPTMKWRHHGIGVLQGYVTENEEPEIRIHIWSRDLIKDGIVDNGDAHNHRFDMVSHVLIGEILHEEIFIEKSNDGDFTTMEVEHARVNQSSGFHGSTTATGKRFNIRRQLMCIPSENLYTFPVGLFHRNIVSNDLTVTIVEKSNQDNDMKAEIIHRVGAEPIMAFGHEQDSATIRTVVMEAISALLLF